MCNENPGPGLVRGFLFVGPDKAILELSHTYAINHFDLESMKLIPVIAVVLLAFPFSAAAEQSQRPEPGLARTTLPLPTELKDKAFEFRQNVIEVRSQFTGELPPRAEDAVNALNARRLEFASSTEARQMHLAEVRARIASTTAEHRERLAQKFDELVVARYEHAMELLSGVVSRLIALADRIDARIALLMERGADTAASEAALEDARAKIAAAEEAIQAVADATAAALEGENPREALKSVAPEVDAAKAALREAHAALVHTLTTLPDAGLSGEEGTI